MSTVGPEAHHIFDERDSERKEWVIIDVGGHRSQRGARNVVNTLSSNVYPADYRGGSPAAWAQFFDDGEHLTFVSAFPIV